MANYCDVMIEARGFKSMEDLHRYCEILENRDWDSGEHIPLMDGTAYYVNPERNLVSVSGFTKWTADRLFDRVAERMREDYPHIIGLQELARRFGIVIEVLGREPGCESGEHYVVDQNGKVVLSEYFNYYEFDPSDFENYEDFIYRTGFSEVTKEEFESDDVICCGKPKTEFGSYIYSLSCKALA